MEECEITDDFPQLVINNSLVYCSSQCRT